MKLAFEVAEKNKRTTRLKTEKKLAGKEWYAGFMRKHHQLNLPAPEATSLARAAGFNKVVVNAFVDVWEKIVKENALTADSSGVSCLL